MAARCPKDTWSDMRICVYIYQRLWIAIASASISACQTGRPFGRPASIFHDMPFTSMSFLPILASLPLPVPFTFEKTSGIIYVQDGCWVEKKRQ